MIKKIVIFFSIIFSIGFCRAQELSIPIKVSCGSDSQILYVGLDPRATDGLDPFLGETPLPPLPPKGGFDARINLPSPSFDSSIRDFRFGNTNSFTAKISYEIQFQTGSSNIIDISWTLPAGVTGTIQDLLGGVVIKKTMGGTGLLSLTNAAINRLEIIFDYNYTATGIENITEYLPTEFNLYQNYPNPFNPTTNISFNIPKDAKVVLKIYNPFGQEIKILVNQVMSAGFHSVNFDASLLSSGVYFYKIEYQNHIEAKKMLLLK